MTARSDAYDRRQREAKPQFGNLVGPTRKRFAWLPVRRWDGVWLWMQHYRATLVVKHDYLGGGGSDTWWWRE